MPEEFDRERAVVASLKPFYCELKPRRSIAWCRCGLSEQQPFCDGSHVGTGFKPLVYKASDEGGEVLLCGCKQTGTPPFCDGTHNNLPGGYRRDERTQEELSRIRQARPDRVGISQLDGRCYVVSPTASNTDQSSRFWLRKIITPSLGAEHQSQFYGELTHGRSPIYCMPNSDVILFIGDGSGAVEIAGRSFKAREGDGLHVRAGESFQLLTDSGLRTFISVLPGVDDLIEVQSPTSNFNSAHPQRICGVNVALRSKMGPRYFQMLVEKKAGSESAAQFIGHIPQGRGEMHRHLYEEALIVMSGEGIMWTEESYAEVRSGDVIFLPRKQAHSLECTSPDGMDVVGFIYPGDNPAINY